VPALRRIGGTLELFSVGALRTVALDQLSAVGGAVTIKSADALTALDGLDALAAVGGKVEISSNDALRTVILEGGRRKAQGTRRFHHVVDEDADLAPHLHRAPALPSPVGRVLKEWIDVSLEQIL